MLDRGGDARWGFPGFAGWDILGWLGRFGTLDNLPDWTDFVSELRNES